MTRSTSAAEIIGISRNHLVLAEQASVFLSTVVDQSWPTYKTLHRIGEIFSVAITGRSPRAQPLRLNRPVDATSYVSALKLAEPAIQLAVL